MTVHGLRLSDLEEATCRSAADTLVERVGIDGTEGVTIVADAHYPYHPTTGMVTNPVVVSALATVLSEHADGGDVTVCLAGGGEVDPARVGRMLGYDRRTVATPDVSLDGVHADSPGTLGAARVPDALLDAPVVVVPSGRVDHETGIAGALTTLTRAAGGDPSRTGDVRTVARTVDPVAAVVDATYTFTGDPYRASALLAGPDVEAIDRILTSLLSVDPDAVSFGNSLEGTEMPSVRGIDLDTLRQKLPDGEPPNPDGPSPLVRAGYRLYTAVSGDIYPPHLRGER